MITFPEYYYNHFSYQANFSYPTVSFPFYCQLHIKMGKCKRNHWLVHSNVLYVLSFRSSSNYRYFSSEAFHFKSQFWTRMIDDSGCYRALTLDCWNPPFTEAELCSIFNWNLFRTHLNHVRVFMIPVSTIHLLPLVHLFLGHLYWLFSIFQKSLSWVILKLQRNLSKRCHACILHLEAMWIKEIEFI